MKLMLSQKSCHLITNFLNRALKNGQGRMFVPRLNAILKQGFFLTFMALFGCDNNTTPHKESSTQASFPLEDPKQQNKNQASETKTQQQQQFQTPQIPQTPKEHYERALALWSQQDSGKTQQPSTTPEALEHLKTAAQGGYSQAQVDLGKALLFGTYGTQQNISEGVAWLEKAVQNQNPEAFVILAEYKIAQKPPHTSNHQEKSKNSPTPQQQNLQSAHSLLKQAAELGNSYAKARLAELYFYKTLGFDGDLFLARKYAEDSYSEGETYAAPVIFAMYMEGKGAPQDPQHAFHILEDAAKRADQRAALSLAKHFISGVYFAKNYNRAQKILNQLADTQAPPSENTAEALYWLGVIEQAPDNQQRNLEKAQDYFQKAAHFGSADAHHALAVLYLKGEVGPADNTKAKIHLDAAAKAGHPLALALKFRLLTTGDGKIYPQNTQAGLDMLESFAKEDHSYAQYLLANYILTRQKLKDASTSPFSQERGRKLLEAAVARDLSEALLLKASLLANGTCGYKKDLKQARALYKQIANRGNLEGIVRYSECVFNGDGGSCDQELAIKYLEHAATLNPAFKSALSQAKKKMKKKQPK